MKASDLYTLFVDLDGVVADLDRFLIGKIGKTFSEHRERDNEIWAALDRMHERGEKTFGALPLIPDARELWEPLRQYQPHILTATGNRYEIVAPEKREWVEKNLPDHGKIITVQKSRDKAQYARPTHVLIDDRMASIGPWREAGGIGILHTNAQSSLDQLRSLGFDFSHTGHQK